MGRWAEVLIRFIALVAVLSAIAVPAGAQEKKFRYQLTPFVGYQFGGEFEDSNTGDQLDLDPSNSYGLIFNWQVRPNTEGELYISRQPTELDISNLAGSPIKADIDVDYYQFGGTYLFDGERSVPFFVLTVGASHFDPQETGLDSETFFAFTFGGGFKMFPTKRIGLRLEGRAFGTLIDTQRIIFCEGGGGATCSIQASGSVLWQWELMAGMTVRF